MFDIIAANPKIFRYDPATGTYTTTIHAGQTLNLPQGAVGQANVPTNVGFVESGPEGQQTVFFGKTAGSEVIIPGTPQQILAGQAGQIPGAATLSPEQVSLLEASQVSAATERQEREGILGPTLKPQDVALLGASQASSRIETTERQGILGSTVLPPQQRPFGRPSGQTPSESIRQATPDITGLGGLDKALSGIVRGVSSAASKAVGGPAPTGGVGGAE
ncbi:hypothetical protein LCGC14_2534090, partial [marine sediment metagenome]